MTRVIVSHDTDFGTLLAARRQVKPSFILVRSSDPLTADDVAGLILANLDSVAEDLGAGAIATFARGQASGPSPLHRIAPRWYLSRRPPMYQPCTTPTVNSGEQQETAGT